jgi:predicted nucleic acid-binding protein
MASAERHPQMCEGRLVDGLYVELARQLGLRLLTTDQRRARSTPIAEAIS